MALSSCEVVLRACGCQGQVVPSLGALQTLCFPAQANDEKLRLEAKQREERTVVEQAGKPWEPRWFYQVRAMQF